MRELGPSRHHETRDPLHQPASAQANEAGEQAYSPGVFALFGMGMLLRFVFALLPLPIHLVLLEDDAWMVTSIARNLALGRGMTADGLHPTNGFHPLYPLTLGVLPYLVRPNDLDFGFRANLLICAILNTLALVPFYAIACQVARPSLALVGLAVVAINPLLIRVSVNAMETSLALLLLLLLWWYGLVRNPTHVGGWVLMGILGGGVILARLDAMMAVGPLGLVLLIEDLGVNRKTETITMVSRRGYHWFRLPLWFWRCRLHFPLRSMVFGGSALLLLLPYFARNIVVFGHLTPSSGRALAYMHSFRESFALTSGLQLIAYQPALDLTRAPTWVLYVGMGIFVLGVWRIWMLVPQYRRSVALLVSYAALLTFYYAYVQQQGQPRYYVGVGFVMVLLTCIWCAHERCFARFPCLWHLSPSRIGPFVGAFLAVGTIGINGGGFYTYVQQVWNAPYLAQPAMYHAARWIAHHLPADARLAAQNSGVFQYYSERVVINFDGKLNHEIIPVLERRELDTYLRNKGVHYIVDLPSVAHYIEYYSRNLSIAPPHYEMSILDKFRIYAQMVAAKLIPRIPPPPLRDREPERMIQPFSAVSTVVQTFPLPNDPTQAVTIYRLNDTFGLPPEE